MFRTMFTASHASSWPRPRQRRSSSLSIDEEDIENLVSRHTFCGREASKQKTEKATAAAESESGGKSGKEDGDTECLKFVCLSRQIAEHGMREVHLSSAAEEPPILLVKLFGEVHALQGQCPNCGARLASGCLLSQQRIICPAHGSAYDIRTGAILSGVGFLSLWVFECRTLSGNVFVKCPLERHRRRFELPVMRACPRRYDYLGIANRPIVIVGAGIAALSCALTLREKGYFGRLVLICREQTMPYDRKSLSKRLWSPTAEAEMPSDGNASLQLFPDQFYDQLSLELMLGVNVREVMPQERTVTLEGHSRHRCLPYSFLVLAMGATPRKLALGTAIQSDVLYVRTLEDAKRLAAECAGKSVAIIGAGMLGVELAGTLKATAKSVTLFGKFASSLAIFGDSVRAEILDWLAENGVTVMRNSCVHNFERFGNRIQICFSDLSTNVGLCAIADKLVGAIGIMPCSSSLLGANIRTDPKGFVLVDERMRTSQPGVLACGDCASCPLPASAGGGAAGQRFNWPHWQMAQHQGTMAAKTILGIWPAEEEDQRQQPRRPQKLPSSGGRANAQQQQQQSNHPRLAVPFFWLDLPAGRHLTFAGWPRLAPDERIQHGTIRDNNLVVYQLRNGQVVSVASCGPTNLAVQFQDILDKEVRISKEQVLRNKEHNWANYSTGP